ncbi:MAG: protease SohB [Porticoccaceae bacterium]|nr:protease SohB [Porticoccaceae bacterium]
MEFLAEYGLFLAKMVTAIMGFGLLVAIVTSASQKNKQGGDRGQLEINPLNDQYDEISEAMSLALIDPVSQKAEAKKLRKDQKKRAKLDSKKAQSEQDEKKRVFVLKFKGNVSASAVSNLREEVTAVLTQAQPKDEVVVKLESSGGMVHSYGLASSQLDRLRKQSIPLTICVDKVAASGGYMMACVGDKILAAPFAIIGSIGVVAQLPNFHRLLKKNDVDFELLTAGEHKRTLTIFGENTEQGREKFIEDLQDTHQLFKSYVAERRPKIDIDKVATGEVWFGSRALDLSLVDELMTSDEYLTGCAKESKVFEINYVQKKKLPQRLGIAAEESADRLLVKWWGRLTDSSNIYK